MINTKSIALIICYYGKMPWYFDYFLHTLKYNPSVDLFLITDIPVDERSLPPNVKLIRMTLAEVNRLFTKKLGFKVEITKPYKLSEFKPASGYLFSHLLAGYDFWAPIDIDVVY